MSLSYDFVNISLCGVRKTWITILLIIVGLALVVQCLTPSISPPQKRAGPSETFKDHCNKTVDIYEDVASPEVTNQNRGRPMTCWYRFRSFRGAPRDWVLRLRFKKFKVGTLVNATYCEGGFLQIVDGNAKTDVSNRREPGMFCGEAEQPQTFISETSYVKILFHADNFTDQTYFSFDSRAEQQMEVYLRYGQHPELYPNRRGEVVQGIIALAVGSGYKLLTGQNKYLEAEKSLKVFIPMGEMKCTPTGPSRTKAVHYFGWNSFLQVNENKEHLFKLLANDVVRENIDSKNCLVISTLDEKVLTSKCYDSHRIAPCNHEEADTRIMIHVLDAVSQGHTKILIRTVDSDVVVLSVALVAMNDKIKELWIGIGTKNKFRSYCEREFRDCRLQTCYVQSPAFPGLYPRALNCRYRLHTRQPFIKLYLQNEHFSVDGQRCENIMTCPMREIGSGTEHCPYDWLAVYDGRDDHAPLIGKFCGVGKFPFSIIGTSQYMFVEFMSSPAGPLLNTGFHFNVGNWPGHVDTAGVKSGACDWLLSSDALRESNGSEGIFLSIAHWYPPNTSCSYLIQGNEGEVVRLYFPSFRINRIEAAITKMSMDCAESLTIYDSATPDPAKIIKTFCDTFSRPMEKVDFVSRGRSLHVRFESKTGSYSGSSLYYWAHYDFFNNTKFGDAVPSTLCDEIFYAWKHPRGDIRSSLNTLIYKRTSGSDVRCQYRFVTDKRLFARVVIEVTSVTFKELPYNMNACTRCHEERVDKLVIWEEKEKVQNHLACFCDNIPRAVRVISSGELISLEMIVQGQHATTSYFKNQNPLFQANYEFAHGPLCGPITLGPSPDGELKFPFPNAIGFPHVGDQKREKCIWELKVAAQRDLWMHLDKSHFSDKSCDLGRIEVYLAGRLEPRFIICPENVSLARDLPILSAAELGALDNENEPLPVLIQYTGDNTPGKNAFRLVWTELFHLPRTADGTVARSFLKDGDCDFKCPGDTSVCIPRHLVCNGIMNCPNVTSTSTLQSLAQNIDENLKMLGIEDSELRFKVKYLTDESPEICTRTDAEDVPYVMLLLIAAGLSLSFAIFLAICCRMCRRRG